jgi:hypothetical protein
VIRSRRDRRVVPGLAGRSGVVNRPVGVITSTRSPGARSSLTQAEKVPPGAP